MADSRPSPTSVGPPPVLIDQDIACPHCGYNLRALIEQRCPECGTGFDPKKLLESLLHDNLPPPVWWILLHIWRPMNFWRQPRIVDSRGPRELQILAFMCLAGMAAQLHILPTIRKDIRDVLGVVFLGGLLGVFLYLFAALHGVLCQLAFRMARLGGAARATRVVVGYSLAWIVPAFPALFYTCVVLTESQDGPAKAVYLLEHPLPWMALGAVSILWAVFLFRGGYVMTDHRWSAALWCVVCCPFWYVAGFCLLLAHAAGG